MEQRENTFAMSQCMLTKQYGKYKAVIQFSAVDRPETEEKVLSLIMGLLFAGKPVGIGIGTVCAVMLVGRVIALFHHIFGKAMLQASGLESGRN